MSLKPEDHRRLVVDGMNVIGSRPTGWWRDRDAAKMSLFERLGRLAEAEGRPVTVIFDGRPLSDLTEGEHGGVEVLYANRSGPNAADDRIVELVAERPAGVAVVSSDLALRGRVAERGAEVEGASWLLKRLDLLERGGS